jgi:uncharacterized protein
MTQPSNFEGARDYAIRRLENELSPDLTYHCLKHTIEEVVPAADRLAREEKIGADERLLLLLGAYYHDLGFIYQRQDHESISIQLAEQALTMFGYTNKQIAIIRGIIKATRIPQSPSNLLEMIIADADLDYLGQAYFWERSSDLRSELANFGEEFINEEWYAYQLKFIQSHHYFTVSQQSLRDANKLCHIREIQERLEMVRNKL